MFIWSPNKDIILSNSSCSYNTFVRFLARVLEIELYCAGPKVSKKDSKKGSKKENCSKKDSKKEKKYSKKENITQKVLKKGSLLKKNSKK